MQQSNTDKKARLEAEVAYWEHQATVCARYMRRATKHQAYTTYQNFVNCFLAIKRQTFHLRLTLMKGVN